MKVFIINLERSLDRKEHMKKQIQKLFEKNPSLKNKLEFIFFKAIDAKNKEHLEFKDHFPWWGSWVYGKDLDLGNTACFVSHYKLWQECVKLDEPIIILEDDVEFSDEFLNNGEEYIDGLLKSEYEYIRLCYLFDKRLYFLSESYGGGGYYLSFKNLSGTQGYVLKPSAAKKFISKAQFIYMSVDDYMDKIYKHKVLNIIKKPLLLKHSLELQSNISQLGRNSQKIKIYRKIIREIFRFYSNILVVIYCIYKKSIKA